MRRLALTSRRMLNQSITDLMLGRMIPDVRQLHAAEQRARIRRKLLLIGLTLTAYRIDHGTYPKNLNELPPQWLNQIELSYAGSKPLHYEQTALGYVVSFGATGGSDDSPEVFQVVKCTA